MALQIRDLLDKFPDLMKLERGSSTHSVTDLRSPQNAERGSLIFLATPTHLNEALQTAAEAWVVHPSLLGKTPSQIPVVISSPNPQLAMALVGKTFFAITKHLQPLKGPKIHDRAIVASSARIGADCVIGPGAVIGENCVIGARTVIGANVVLEPDVKVGSDCHIHPLVFVGHSCELGNRCEVHPNTTIGTEGFGYAQDKAFNHYRITHYGRVIVEDDVHIGSGVQIDKGTFLDSRVGAGTKIDNHCHFAHNIVIGKNSLITAGMIAAGTTTIGNYCVFGGRTSLGGHLTVGDRVQLGGLSGLTKSLTEPGEYAGFPVQPLKAEIRTRAALKELPNLVKQVRSILKHLGLDQSPHEASHE